MANVRQEAERVRALFTKHLEITTDVHSPLLVLRVAMFLSALDRGLYILAGSLKIDHGFLFSFYGITATYLAVLVSAATY